MYYHFRWTYQVYPFDDYFQNQIVYVENELTNKHFHAIIQVEYDEVNATKQHIKRQKTSFPGAHYSFTIARDVGQLQKYIAKEGRNHLSTFEIPAGDLKKNLFSISHKKSETFIQYVLATYSHGSTEQHVLDCFLKKEVEISKTKFRNARTTLLFHIGFYDLDDIPEDWLELEL